MVNGQRRPYSRHDKVGLDAQMASSCPAGLCAQQHRGERGELDGALSPLRTSNALKDGQCYLLTAASMFGDVGRHHWRATGEGPGLIVVVIVVSGTLVEVLQNLRRRDYIPHSKKITKRQLSLKLIMRPSFLILLFGLP